MISKQIIEQYIDEGWLYKQVHPTLSLMILNYSDKTQYERFWNQITLKCRGLILDFDYNIVAEPFGKFFNIEEIEELPSENYCIEEKLDGSLGIAFYYQNQWIFSSRGSFTSDQATKGFQLFNKFKYNEILDIENTYCFEIIYPENQIVIPYKTERLVLLAVLRNGKDINHSYSIDVPKKFTFLDELRSIKQYINKNEEGYVIKYENGFRVKIKGEEYLRLHKLCTNISNRDILKYLIENKPIDELIDKVPDEFFKFVKTTIKQFKIKYSSILKEAFTNRLEVLNKLSENYSRKEYALEIKSSNYNNMNLLFAIEDNKNLPEIVWGIIKKEVDFKQPFKDNI